MIVYRVNRGLKCHPVHFLAALCHIRDDCTPPASANLLWWKFSSPGKPIPGLKLSSQLNLLLLPNLDLAVVTWTLHYCSPYLLWSTGFCRHERCLGFYEWVCTHQVCRVVFTLRSSLTTYSFAKAQLLRLKPFHARHFPQALFHPLPFLFISVFLF